MGLSTAIGLAGTETTLEQQLAMHFATNCYPPIPKAMIPVAVAAIDAYWEEDFARVIKLPEGVQFRNGEDWVFASQAVDSLRLDAWLQEIYHTDEDED